MEQITVEVRTDRDCDTLKKTGTVDEIAAWIGEFGFTAEVAGRFAAHLSSSEDAMIQRPSPVVLRETGRGAKPVEYTFSRRPHEAQTRHAPGVL